jgi:uncharacterized RDD family membrane protein YckC
MSTIKITTTQNIELEYELASLGDRIVGRILDGLIIGAYAFIVIMIFVYGTNRGGSSEFIGVLAFLAAMPVVFYDLVSEILMNGQSVGKRVMKIKVISLDGGQATIGQYMLRWLFRIVDFSLTSSLCALICVAASERRQRLGDMIAGTTLIKTTPRTSFQQTIYVPTAPVAYTVTFPEVANLSDKDMQLIKEVLISVNKTGNGMLAYQAAEKLKQTLGVTSNLEPLYFLQVLLADYNHITSKL